MCQSLKFLVENFIKARHLKRYVKEGDHREESRQAANKVTTGVAIPTNSRPAINYILGGPSDDQYQSKRQQKKLLRVVAIKIGVNAIHTKGSHEETGPIDGPISFPSVNPNRIIVLHYDALVFTLYINGFDVYKLLINPGSAIGLLQLPAFKQMKLSLGMLNSDGRILFGFNRKLH